MSIKNTILDRYQIDIDEINLIKLYKIESADITQAELQKKLEATRKRWSQGANSPNEMIAARDKTRLAQADTFEEILLDKKYLKELVDYHTNGEGMDNSACEFAKEFFTALKGVNRIISQRDFNFFMQYFREERRNERAILEVLKKEFHAVTLKHATQEDEDEQSDKNSKTTIAQSRFNKDTLCLLHKIEVKYAEIQKSPFLQKKFPNLNQSLYKFVKVEDNGVTDFLMYLDGEVQAIFTARQNDSLNSNEYIPLSEFYNDWKDLVKRPDVADNFYTFKKLIQYPKLTPYMYLAENVDVAFLKMLLKTVCNGYGFGSLDDFLFLYFKPMTEGKHFSFTVDKKLKDLLKKTGKDPEQAEKDAQSRRTAAKRRKMIPLPLHILRYLATWPMLLVQLLFEAFRFMVVNIQQLAWVLLIFVTVLWSHAFYGSSIFQEIGNIFANLNANIDNIIFEAARTFEYNNFVFVLGILFMVVKFAFKHILGPTLLTIFLYSLAEELDRGVDLMGFHKTFQNIQRDIEKKLLYYYQKMGKNLYPKMVFPIIANIITTVVVVIAVLIIISFVGFLGGTSM